MYSFNSLVNCIILVCLLMIFAGPLGQASWNATTPGNRTGNVLVQGMNCSCNLSARTSPMRDDYLFTPTIGVHKFHPRAITWNEARKVCIEEGGHLAVVNSKAEARVLMEIFNRTDPVKDAHLPGEAFIGIHDMYKEGDWVTIFDEPLAKTGFTEWSDKWGGQPDNADGRQNCGTFFNEGTLVDVDCLVLYPFFCELPLVRCA